MKIYTQTGDAGETSIIGGRVKKDDLRVEAYGSIDECNSHVGVLIAIIQQNDAERFHDLMNDLTQIQHELFDCGSDLAYADPKVNQLKVTDEMVSNIEASIDRYDAETPDITKFILPGGTMIAAQLHVCRTVVRRVERRIVSMAEHFPVHSNVIKYVNRLSDWFFTVARVANHRVGTSDIEYIRSADVFKKTK